MIIVLGVLFLTILCLGVAWLLIKLGLDGEILGVIGGIIGIGFIISLIVLPFCRADARAKIDGFNAVQQTLEMARANPNISPLELAAIQQSAVDQNRILARCKYWAKSPLTNWFYPKEILLLKPIK